ncbi:NAD(P)-dependent oxidoreductase [Paludisphaera sp.]|uniref:NAD-dependent epimerase/dehydratase family protein n=1 Tax=Paludisphaera sp. TaxID=2017432 RepID=UPI00301C1414
MRIAVTGATGFVGRYIVANLLASGHRVVAWRRASSDLFGFPEGGTPGSLEWIDGGLGDDRAARELVRDADAVVHAAVDRPGRGFVGDEGDVLEFVDRNVTGSIRLMERAREAGVGRFVFLSSGAVHDVILPDRPLDETHPSWSRSHYGASKGAVEAFVADYGLSGRLAACSLRPCGVYGLARRPADSKWFDLVREAVAGRPVECRRGAKVVHAADVAKAVAILLDAEADAVSGRMFNCCDRYVSEHEVAQIARRLADARGPIEGEPGRPRNEIVTDRLRALGMTFGGAPLLERTVAELVAAARG